MAQQKGWQVDKLKIDDGCYEIKGRDKDGQRFKAKIDPVTLDVVRMKREGSRRSRRGQDTGECSGEYSARECGHRQFVDAGYQAPGRDPLKPTADPHRVLLASGTAHAACVPTGQERRPRFAQIRSIQMKAALPVAMLVGALAVPSLASARQVSFETQMSNYGGDGAYVALYLTDNAGRLSAHVVGGRAKAKYHKNLRDWYRAAGAPRKWMASPAPVLAPGRRCA
jgi:hypothetical protein